MAKDCFGLKRNSMEFYVEKKRILNKLATLRQQSLLGHKTWKVRKSKQQGWARAKKLNLLSLRCRLLCSPGGSRFGSEILGLKFMWVVHPGPGAWFARFGSGFGAALLWVGSLSVCQFP